MARHTMQQKITIEKNGGHNIFKKGVREQH